MYEMFNEIKYGIKKKMNNRHEPIKMTKQI